MQDLPPQASGIAVFYSRAWFAAHGVSSGGQRGNRRKTKEKRNVEEGKQGIV
ncbi:MAG: hypothetical protein NC305_15295 [Lachnospiraceae bacterium]|nr:hypothetical protein [Butyrivibrio sp.]MCM1411893.1 hypothetical protein [Lachnospiraceae bacterium]